MNSVAELFGRRAVIGDDWTRIIRGGGAAPSSPVVLRALPARLYRMK